MLSQVSGRAARQPNAVEARISAVLRPEPARWLPLCAFLLYLAAILLLPIAASGFHPLPAAAQASGNDGSALSELRRVEAAFASVVRRVTPGVVGIRVQRAGGHAAGDPIAIVNGSGSIIDANGLILTNEHVIQAAQRIEVLLSDGSTVLASVLSSDPRSDLAVLRIPRHGLTPVRFVDFGKVERGQWSVALGNPFGLGGDGKLSVSVGVISNLGRRLPGLGEVDDRLYTDMIQTTASINPGNSGGPLFNLDGELIGIVTAMHTRAPADEGIGFAIPLSAARRQIIERLCAGERIEYGYLGVQAAGGELAERRRAGLTDNLGVRVERIEPSGPAEQAGLQAGDWLLRVDGEPITDAGQLAERVGRLPAGFVLTVDYRRAGSDAAVQIKLGRRQIGRVAALRGDAFEWRGARFSEAGSVVPERVQIKQDEVAAGVVVSDVSDGSVAARAGLKIGDVIEKVDGAVVRGVNDLRKLLSDRPGTVKLSIRARGEVEIRP